MFIEKIPNAVKQAYIQKIVDGYNAAGADLQVMHGTQWSGEILHQAGYDQKVAELNQRNVFFGIYQTMVKEGWNCRSQEFAVVAALSDTAVKTFKINVGTQNYLAANYANTLEFIHKHRDQIFTTNPLATNHTYIKEFMLPNLAAIDQAENTHLVADYKVALSQNFKKKQRLIAENFRRQKADLGLEK